MRLPRTKQQEHNDFVRRMTGGTLYGRVRSAAPISPKTKPTRRTVGVTSEKPSVDVFAWYRADLIDANDGDIISSWDDQSGNGRHVSTPEGNDSPVYREGVLEGKAALDFGGTATRLEAAYDLVGPFDRVTMLAVITVDSSQAGVTVMGALEDGDNLLINFLSEADSWWELSTWDANFDNVGQIFPSPGVQDADRIAEARRTSTDIAVYIDNSFHGDGSHTVEALSTNLIKVGGNWDQGYLGEVVFLVGDQVDDRDTWYNDLVDRWGL